MSEFYQARTLRVCIVLMSNSSLSLICVMGKGNSADKRVLIDYNVEILCDALLQVFKV